MDGHPIKTIITTRAPMVVIRKSAVIFDKNTKNNALYNLLLTFLDALASLGSMLESEWVSHSCF